MYQQSHAFEKVYLCSRSFPSKEDELLDDNENYYYPHRIGRSILICGRKSSTFPFQLFVGPDWPCMCITYGLIITPVVFFINNVGRQYGPGIIFLTLFLLLLTLSFYSFTACSDPGIIFTRIEADDIELGRKTTKNSTTVDSGPIKTESPGSSSDSSNDNIISNLTSGESHQQAIQKGRRVSSVAGADSQLIECGLCQIHRPRNAYHCHDCGVCVLELDHHCPWTGKCIGKKTIKTFYGFLWCLTILIGFVIVMVIITAVRGSPIFNNQ